MFCAPLGSQGDACEENRQCEAGLRCSEEICDAPIPDQGPDPIAMRLMNDSSNFEDRCTPSSDCWPSEDAWDELNNLLGGKLLRDVEPYLKPCRDPFR